jgi:hypothetical protein
MQNFIHKHRHAVTGVLSGFDRLVLRGTLRQLSYVQGMLTYLSMANVLLKDFAQHVEAMSKRLKHASLAVVLAAGRPIHYLSSPKADKACIAKTCMIQDRIEHGPICTLTCVEPCQSYRIVKNPQSYRLELQPCRRQCLHLYHYFIHPTFGFMHARIQTWFPFSIQICINGREWLSRQMDKEGLGYQRKDNAFIALEDVNCAQELMNQQVNAPWSELLTTIARRLNPAHGDMFANFSTDYYWSVHQSEWATDIMFKTPQDLARIYPQLIQHGIRTFGSADVMRFLGQRIPAHGHVHRNFTGEIVSDVKDRPDGVRIKHRIDKNSLKLYDKFGCVLRAESTLNSPRPFLVYRKPEGKSDTAPRWLPLRKGMADIARRAEVSHKANKRYLDAYAAVDEDMLLGQLTEPLCRHSQLKGKRVRGLNPFRKDDLDLLSAISSGEFCLHGMRNKDLRLKLFGDCQDANTIRRQSAMVTRKLRMLRAHGLINKVSRSHRYLVTLKGRTALAALLAARDASTKKLTSMAA